MSDSGDIHSIDVLLVEDSAFQANLMKRILNVVGVREVVIAENGRQALDLLKAEPGRFAVIVCDLVMPEMTGYELVAAVRDGEAPGAEEVPIVIATGAHGEEDRHMARLKDVQGYIRKPATTAAVFEALKSALSR
jgi:two-component system chemotaxis response regulator CheY